MVLFSEDHIQETKRRGRIEVICGSMFSGKTEELIRRLKRAKFAKQRVDGTGVYWRCYSMDD